MAREKLAEKLMTVCGNTIFTILKMKNTRSVNGKRKEKKNPTIEEVVKINKLMAEKNLAIKINHNFKPGDMHVCLTYRNEPSATEAHKALDFTIKKFRAELKKMGITLKAIHATEYKNKRLHHHIVMSKIDLEAVRKIWSKYGDIVRVAILDNSKDYRALAHYIIKETEKTFRDADAFSKRRYNCTRSVVMPITKAVDANPSEICESPKAEKGYYVDKDSVFKGANPFTGQPFVMYVQVSLDAEQPRLKTIRRGKPKKAYADYSNYIKKHMPKQTEMEIPF